MSKYFWGELIGLVGVEFESLPLWFHVFFPSWSYLQSRYDTRKCIFTFMTYLVVEPPSWKNISSSKLDHFPAFRGEQIKTNQFNPIYNHHHLNTTWNSETSARHFTSQQLSNSQKKTMDFCHTGFFRFPGHIRELSRSLGQWNPSCLPLDTVLVKQRGPIQTGSAPLGFLRT